MTYTQICREAATFLSVFDHLIVAIDRRRAVAALARRAGDIKEQTYLMTPRGPTHVILAGNTKGQ
jgi:hypothetical protein